jgi:hypothetical protein
VQVCGGHFFFWGGVEALALQVRRPDFFVFGLFNV